MPQYLYQWLHLVLLELRLQLSDKIKMFLMIVKISVWNGQKRSLMDLKSRLYCAQESTSLIIFLAPKVKLILFVIFL